MVEKLSHTDRSVINKFRHMDFINSSQPSWKTVVNNPQLSATSIKMCIGALMYVYHPVEYSVIALTYKRKYPFCAEHERETEWDLL